MANAITTVSKQLENVHETLASTKRHLSKKLENLDFKVEEQKEITQLIANDVNEVKSNLSQIGFAAELIHQMVSGLEGEVDLIESKQDDTNSGLWYLCQVADGVKGQLDTKPLQNVSAKLGKHSTTALEDKSPKGLQFFADNEEQSTTEKSMTKKNVF